VLLLALLVFGCGCMRYTPSRLELEEQAKDEGSKAPRIGGEEQFYLYESLLKSRLNNLIAARSHLLTRSPAENAYTLGRGDVITVSLLGFEKFNSDAMVSTRGDLTLPLVGAYHAEGKDLATAQEELTERYARYIRAPAVSLTLKNYQANQVSVIGEVARPGVYPLRRQGQLLTELLAEAGGKTQNAAHRLILLPAQGAAAPHASTTATVMLVGASATPDEAAMGIEIELEDLLGHSSQRPLLIPLMAGDLIIVPEAGNYEVDGEVAKPGSYKLAGRTSALSAIAAAGGFSYAADVHHVEVIRETGAGSKALVTLDLEEVGLRGGHDVRLSNGDIVRIPSEPTRFFKRQIVAALNSLFNGVNISQRVNP
jgi:polysaccharide export outer membrane protein